MNTPPEHSSRMSDHVYDNEGDPVPFELGARLDLEGRRYVIVYIAPPNDVGYQGAIYQAQDNGDLHAVHRGTETEGEELKLDVKADVQMVIARANAQTPYAEALTREAMRLAKDPEQWPDGVTSEPAIFHAGHSLGGFHAQDRAAAHGHGGASFSAFGAAGIGRAPAGIVEGAPEFVSHMRATDVVALGSRHYGRVVNYATEQDLETVTRGPGRVGTEGPGGFIRNVAEDVKPRHSIAAYADGTVMTPENRQRYLDHQPLFEEHFRAVHESREWITYGGDVAKVAINVAAATAATTPVSPAQRVITGGLSGAVAAASVDRPEVPAPFQRIEGEVEAIGRRTGAALVDRAGDAIEATSRDAGGALAARGRDVGHALGGVVRQGSDRVADGVDAVRERVAATQRGEGEAKQTLFGLAAGAADAVGLDGLAEDLRGRGLDARVDAENVARRTEAALIMPSLVARAGGDAAATTTETLMRATTAGLGVAAAGKGEDADRSADAVATGIRLAANTDQDARYGATAPNLDMRATAREKITALYAEHDRPPLTSEQLDRMSAAVVADARERGMTSIDTVMFSQGKGNGPDFDGRLIAFDRNPYRHEFATHSATPIAKAQETPVEESVERTRAANERQEQLQLEIQQMQARDQAMKESQGMSMRIGARTMDGLGEGAGAGGGDGGGGG